MRSNKLPILIGLLVIVLSVLACSGSVTTANIADAWMSTDEEGNNRTTVYTPNAVFYVQADLRNAPDDTRLKAVWIAVDVEGADPNLTIYETEFVSGSGLVHFSLSNNNPWPQGKYKVELYLDDKLAKTVEFEVK
ncbi:hypothetical protein SE15_08735 [Thermanaerothrix daxensis]|uniref:Uncharacterized protein n=1 Tax=Thermanaerothrix daxensis TaxID=869279 RepID=A0A0P6Y0B5_9CHLR|nr:hypothetical protein [Thermanaerothrix daxensis]KPL82283.1 hypothetical protein SE15_08735 [Thermanaerothrix daxensis]